MTRFLFWPFLFSIFGILFFLFLFQITPAPAGDIAEYFGMTQSLLNHGNFTLSTTDQLQLAHLLNPGYFSDPQYYITALDGLRHPVHFYLYSILATPVRILLETVNLNPLKTLAITNLVILFLTIAYLCLSQVTQTSKRFLLVIVTLMSPLIFFISWPGPDLLYICLLLLTLFNFFGNRLKTAIIFSVLASWHSQPVIVISSLLIGYYYISIIKQGRRDTSFHSRHIFSLVAFVLLSVFLILLPYLNNYVVFGVFSPWTIIANGWTRLRGFGVQNISLKKTIEQFFDLNYGIFWYAPILLLSTAIIWFKNLSNPKHLFIGLTFLSTTIFYQTNPAWHYGTAGFGPSRHIIFLLPLLIYYTNSYITSKKAIAVFTVLYIPLQLYILNFNSFVNPHFENTLYHSPYALYALNNFPHLYNPTPEIFVDRTNHTDFDHPSSAIYKINGQCRKAYILKSDISYLTNQCDPSLIGKQLSEIKQSTQDGVYVNFK